jgi:hypothetical protein
MESTRIVVNNLSIKKTKFFSDKNFNNENIISDNILYTGSNMITLESDKIGKIKNIENDGFNMNKDEKDFEDLEDNNYEFEETEKYEGDVDVHSKLHLEYNTEYLDEDDEQIFEDSLENIKNENFDKNEKNEEFFNIENYLKFVDDFKFYLHCYKCLKIVSGESK